MLAGRVGGGGVETHPPCYAPVGKNHAGKLSQNSYSPSHSPSLSSCLQKARPHTHVSLIVLESQIACFGIDCLNTK